MTDDLASIRARIRALRAKAADAACTESEAMAAASLAAKLLEKHDLTEAELGSDHKPEAVEYGTAKARGTTIHPVQRMTGVSIGKLTETKVWIHDNAMLKFAGMPADIEMATFLAEMLMAAGERGWMQAWMDCPMGDPAKRKMDLNEFKAGFYFGFSTRVAGRMNELAQARQSARVTTASTALVTGKRALIEAKLRHDGLYFEKSRKSNDRGSAAGFAAGQTAGDGVGLGRPVESNRAGGPIRIGA